MNNRLKIKIKRTQWARMSEQESKDLLFGEIIFFVESPSGDKLFKILDMPLPFKNFVTWVKDNKKLLLESKIPIEESFSSIAESVDQFYECLDSYLNLDDGVDEKMYAYRVSHSFRFAFEGIDVPDIYIGLYKTDYEVSFCAENNQWSYQFDMKEFIKSVEQANDQLSVTRRA